MKKILLYIVLICAIGGVAAFAFMKEEKKELTFLPLKERNAKLAVGDEWIQTKSKAETLYQQIQTNMANNRNNDKIKLQLAEIYIQEGRITGDRMYYDQAAMHLVNDVLKTDSVNFEALSYKSMLYLSEHHFTEGLEYAHKAQQINPYNAFVYGLLTDANLELGNYTEAVAMADKMMSVRPDIRSYSRVSYLREIHGDYSGAIEAMKSAVSAGYPGLEETEWARMQLGHLYEYTGDLKNAEVQYRTALMERDNYAYAYAGLGRLSRAQKNYAEAITYYQKADSMIEDYSFKNDMVDLYTLAGNQKAAKETAEKVLDQLNADAEGGNKDDNIGHYADMELAYVYAKTGNYNKAAEHAMLEYNRRPGNIDVNEALAWMYYKQGKTADAQKHIEMALKTNSQNPVLLSHAAMIYQKAGNTVKAKELKDLALKNNPDVAPDLLQELNNTVGVGVAVK